MNVKKKGLIIGLGIFLVILVGVVVVYLVLNSTGTPKPSPMPVITPQPKPVPVVPEVFEVGDNTCSLVFNVVAVGSPSPSPSGSPSPSPSPSPSTTPGAALDCVVKRIYEDDTRNIAGNYYLEKEILDTTTLTSGQTIVYNVQVANNGGVAVSDTTISDVLASNLAFKDADPDCTYVSGTRTVTCSLGSLPANTQSSRSIRVTVSVTGTQTVENEAKITSTNGQSDSCKITVSATGQVLTSPSPTPRASTIVAVASEVPEEVPTELPEAGVFSVTANTLGLGLLLLIAGALGLLLL